MKTETLSLLDFIAVVTILITAVLAASWVLYWLTMWLGFPRAGGLGLFILSALWIIGRIVSMPDRS
ncbi:hypothetical protein LCGC14_1362030 [marine sediment metagenome]|uniref:Uncharacterized protein n=1 Tax=marine sediment metagenome TaxID=412755 RepID=A0A0F9KTW3_9ZZZZ